MEALDYWMLNEEFTVQDTIMLSLGFLPGRSSYDIERKVASGRPEGYDPLKKLLLNKIKNGKLEAKVEYDRNNDFHSNPIDIDQSTVHRDDIIKLFREIGFKPHFFFPNAVEGRSYVDQNHACYAPKLAAAIAAWEAVTNDESLVNGKTPKKALEKWLRENASHFGLTKDDGSPNETGIEEISKIANWKPEGGVAKTSTRVQRNPPTPKKPNVIEEFVDSSPAEVEETSDCPF